MATEKKTISNERIINAYRTLDAAKLAKMEVADRFTLIKALRPMKKVSAEFDDFREDAIKRLKPENYGEIAEAVNRFNEMSQEEREAAISEKKYADALKANLEFNNSMNDCLKEELTKETELDFATLPEEAFGKLLDSNPEWTLGIAMELEEILC